MFVRRFLRVGAGGCIFLPPRPPAHCYFSTPCSFWGWKTTGGRGVAGVEVEVAASAQLSKRSGGEPGRLRAPRKGRELFRLQQTAPSLSFSGTRPSGSPGSSPEPPPPSPRLPSPPLLLRARRAAPLGDQPRSPHAPRGRSRGSGGETLGGQQLGTRTCRAKRAQVSRGWWKKFFGGGVFCAGADAGCGEGFLPLRVVWASGSGWRRRGEERGCRLRGCPRGRPVTSLGDTQPARKSPCPGDTKTLASGSARTRLLPKDIS